MTKGLYLQKLLLLAEGITTAEFAVMMVIADHLNETTGNAWPGFTRLQQMAKIRGRATISKVRKSLEAKGLVRVTGVGQQSNRYEPIFENIRKLCPPDSLIELETREDVAQVVQGLNRSRTELVQGVNHGSSRSEPQVVQEVNHPSSRSELERPRERPLEPSEGPPQPKPENRGCPSDRIQGVMNNQTVKALILKTDEMMRNRKLVNTPWNETKGDVTKVATSLESFFITFSNRRRMPTPEEVFLALDSEAFDGLKSLSWGLLCLRKEGSDQPLLRKLEKALNIVMEITTPTAADCQSVDSGEAATVPPAEPRPQPWMIDLYRKNPTDPAYAWVGEMLT